jgi:hypothetical protein
VINSQIGASYWMTFPLTTGCIKKTEPFQIQISYNALSPSRRREAQCEDTNSPRLFTPGETKALAKSKVHQLSRAWVTNGDGWVHRYRRPRLLTHTWRRRGLHDKCKMAVQQGKKTIDSITKIRIFAVFAVALFRNLFGQVLW